MDVRTSNHLWLQRHPLIVVLLDQIRPLLLETHRDDPLLDRVDSEFRWTFGLLIISGFSVIRCPLLLETHRDDPLLDRVDSELRWTFGLLIISGFSVIR